MYVCMATWPIASRDVAGTPVPRLFPVACPWLSPELERWATSHTHHVISQPRPSPFLRRYSLPRKSKRARNGEGLGPRLCISYMVYMYFLHGVYTQWPLYSIHYDIESNLDLTIIEHSLLHVYTLCICACMYCSNKATASCVVTKSAPCGRRVKHCGGESRHLNHRVWE